jgi:hypothetical protein
MAHYKNFVILFLLSVFLILLPSISLSETKIYLKDGRVIKVDSFWREEGMVKYESFGGIIGIHMEEVDRIISPDILAFEEAKKLDSVEAYEEFIKKHPRSGFVTPAKDRIRELQFDEVKRINSANVYLDYIRRNPNSIYLEEAKGQAEILIFQDAARSYQAEKYQGYLDIYPQGRFHQAAQKALEFISVETLKQRGSIPDMETFLHANPDSTFRHEIEDHLAHLVSVHKVKAQEEMEKKEKSKRLMELEASKKQKRWIFIASVLSALIVAVIVTFLLLRKRRVSALSDIRSEMLGEDESETGARDGTATSGSSVRYEDLIGAPKKSDSGRDEIKALDHDRPISLPNPEDISKQSEEDQNPEEPEESPFKKETSPGVQDSDSIILGYNGKETPAAEAPESENEIDLSDHDTDFKLELEDVPEEREESGGHETSTEGELDLSEGDLPDMFEDEEVRRRRGGGSKG